MMRKPDKILIEPDRSVTLLWFAGPENSVGEQPIQYKIVVDIEDGDTATFRDNTTNTKEYIPVEIPY